MPGTWQGPDTRAAGTARLRAEAAAMRWFLGLLILAALAGVGWLLLGAAGQGEAPGHVVEDVAPVAQASAPEGVLLQGHGADGLRASRAATGRATLDCRVVREGQPAVATVEVRFVAVPQAIFQVLWWQRWQRDLFTPP